MVSKIIFLAAFIAIVVAEHPVQESLSNHNVDEQTRVVRETIPKLLGKNNKHSSECSQSGNLGGLACLRVCGALEALGGIGGHAGLEGLVGHKGHGGGSLFDGLGGLGHQEGLSNPHGFFDTLSKFAVLQNVATGSSKNSELKNIIDKLKHLLKPSSKKL